MVLTLPPYPENPPPPFTPAPWAWFGNDLRPAEPDPQRYAVHTIVSTEGGGYGFLSSRPAQTLAEIDADRRLIAAAPDLLTALQNLRNACAVALAGSEVLAAADTVIDRALGVGL